MDAKETASQHSELVRDSCARAPSQVPIGWAAGIQYDGDIFRANNVLSNLSTFFPSTPPQKCYEVAGFFWWQGDKDSRDMGLSTHYEENLVALIKGLRVQYDSPNAKVTIPCV